MPLTEFTRMSKGRVDATQQRASLSSDPSCRPETDFMELVWENGQIMMQGQSNKPRKGPVSNNFQTLAPKPQEGRNANCSKMVKFSMDDSIAVDLPLSVPSCEMGLDHDVEMVPWLNYPIEESLHNEYTFDFLRDLSGVTLNDLPAENDLACREKKSSFQCNRHSIAMDNAMSLKHGNSSKVRSSTEKHRQIESSEVPQFSPPFQYNTPISGISDITGNNNGSSHRITSQNTFHNPSSLRALSSARLQKFDAGQPSTSSGFTNFPCLSRHAALARTNDLNIKSSNIPENDDKRQALSSNNATDSTHTSVSCSQKNMVTHDQSAPPPINGNSESFPGKHTGEVLSSNQAKCGQDVSKNDIFQNTVHSTIVAKAGMAAEKTMEPVVATSSVCSGNTVERASNGPSRHVKRKSRETESEGPSEEVEEESVGARKAPTTRTGSKRTRAAEVHNLSERRRRDRINEKMRALQELIPNCNKVDKASMLDEAIEYLKTLQLQVQMLSMGAGLYMQPVMVPPGIQPIQGSHMPHFSPIGIGMGMGMGFGFNMLDVNSGMKMMPFQGLPIPSAGPAFHGMPSSSLQTFGHPGQGLPMPIHRPPLLPASALPSLNIPVGLNVTGVAGSANAVPLAPSICSKNAGQQMLPSSNVEWSMNQAPHQ